VHASGQKLSRLSVEILQVNLGKLCNLACVHCHVEAGPTKTEENMDRKTVDALKKLMSQSGVRTLDLTGGAPEMNPYFRELVRHARSLDMDVIDRCNLTVLYESGQADLPQFLADNKVQIVASLPCYSSENVDKQRGKGTFGKSIDALLLLNQLNYGKEHSGLELNLVYNPVGAHLPPEQEGLQQEYKQRLQEDFGICFNHLYTITNMPITRYAKYLKAFDQYADYVELLINSFNPQTVDGLMCRNTMSIGWDGKIYDCDFNQMLGMQLRSGKPLTIFDLELNAYQNLDIITGEHCFGCTAGSGSSCQGALE